MIMEYTDSLREWPAVGVLIVLSLVPFVLEEWRGSRCCLMAEEATCHSSSRRHRVSLARAKTTNSRALHLLINYVWHGRATTVPGRSASGRCEREGGRAAAPGQRPSHGRASDGRLRNCHFSRYFSYEAQFAVLHYYIICVCLCCVAQFLVFV